MSQAVKYALLQTTLEVPPVDALRRAFRSVRCLTDADAHSLANDAYGILVKNLPAQEAATLQGALHGEGIPTEIVAQALLPALPPTKFVKRVEYGPDALLVYDPLGRRFPVEWRHLMLLAAGSVAVTEFVRPQVSGVQVLSSAISPFTPTGMEIVDRAQPVGARERRVGKLTLELILTGAVARFTLVADDAAPVLFACLGDRQTRDRETDFRLLVRDMAARAPGTLLNRGAYLLREEEAPAWEYPTRNAFHEELLWILWRAQR